MARGILRGHFNLSLTVAALLWSAAALATEPGQHAPPKPLDPAAVFERASPSVVVVQAVTGEGISQGSGVVVAEGEVVTNFHVIKGAQGLVTVKQGSRSWRAEVSGVDKENDLARLTVLLRQSESFDLKVAQLRPVGTCKVGERVYAIGAPRGLEQTLTDGLISGLHSAEGQTFVQTSAAISSGSSGGGLFDAHGELVGITTMYLRESQNLNFAVPADRVDWLMGRPYEPHVPPAPIAQRPSGTQPAAASAKGPELPIALGQVRTLFLIGEATGPIATDGDLTSEWLTARVAQRLRKAGLKVITDKAALRDAKTYVVLVGAELSSLDASSAGIYPWMFGLEIMDRTQFTDGSKAHVTLWNKNTFGYGGSQVVVDQVVETVDQLADQLALAILAARTER